MKRLHMQTLVAALLVLLPAVAGLWQADAQERQTIDIPRDLNTEEDIRRFIQRVLLAGTDLSDPFVPGDQRSVNQEPQYEVEDKPRPAEGLGRYDVEQLTLKGIWQQGEESVALVSAPDGKSFIIRVGEEAYDGRIVNIDHESGTVTFLQELRRTGGAARPGEPEVKYVEKVVSFRR